MRVIFRTRFFVSEFGCRGIAVEDGADVASLRAGQAEIRAIIRALEERTAQLEHALNGNGRAGLIETVTRIDAGISLLKWLWISTIIPFAAALIYELVRGH